MKKWILAAVVVVLQVLVLVYMAGEREGIVRNGKTIFLRTAPVDPRDHFRGDYVRLDYEISHVPTNLITGAFLQGIGDTGRKERPAYVALRQGEAGLASLVGLSDQPPSSGLFLRGRVKGYWAGPICPVTYGLEAFFTQQEKAKAMEMLRMRDGVQVPLEMEVAVSSKGVGVIKGYRWCALGLGLQIEPVSRTNQNIARAVFTLKNVSSNSVAIVKPIRGRTLVLENDRLRGWGNQEWSWVGKRELASITDDDVLMLAPGQSYDVRIDFGDSGWFVTKKGHAPRSLGGLGWESMFRLEYTAPTREQCQHLKQAAFLWHGELKSRAFGGGRVD